MNTLEYGGNSLMCKLIPGESSGGGINPGNSNPGGSNPGGDSTNPSSNAPGGGSNSGDYVGGANPIGTNPGGSSGSGAGSSANPGSSGPNSGRVSNLRSMGDVYGPGSSPKNGPPHARSSYFGDGFIFNYINGYVILDHDNTCIRGFTNELGEMFRSYQPFAKNVANALEHAAEHRPCKTAAYTSCPWDFDRGVEVFIKKAHLQAEPHWRGIPCNTLGLRLYLTSLP